MLLAARHRPPAARRGTRGKGCRAYTSAPFRARRSEGAPQCRGGLRAAASFVAAGPYALWVLPPDGTL